MAIKVWTAHALVNVLVGVVMRRRHSDGGMTTLTLTGVIMAL